MVYEFALEPELVARWHDRKEYLFFDEKFGLRSRRFVSAYPKTWKKLVWMAFKRGPAAENQNAQVRISELIQHFWHNSVRRHSTFPEIVVWLERAEAEHAERPFRAIIATTNPRQQPFVILCDDLIEDGHHLWRIPETSTTPRTPAEIACTVSPLLRLCRHAMLVDPYFDPTKRRFCQTLEAILSTCDGNVCGLEEMNIELHTSIDRFSKGWERGESRSPKEEARVYDNFVMNCMNRLPDLVPAGIQLKVVVWKQRENGEKLHNRYLLTNLLGVMFGTGSDASENPDSEESDDIVLLTEGQYLTRFKQYTIASSAFDLVGEPFFIRKPL